jgi:hypothetical protein
MHLASGNAIVRTQAEPGKMRLGVPAGHIQPDFTDDRLGHRAESVYRRYAIADERDLRIAVAQLESLSTGGLEPDFSDQFPKACDHTVALAPTHKLQHLKNRRVIEGNDELSKASKRVAAPCNKGRPILEMSAAQ